MPEIEGTNREISIPVHVMPIQVSVNDEQPQFCMLMKGNLQCPFMNVVHARKNGVKTPVVVYPDLDCHYKPAPEDEPTTERSWYCLLFRKVLASQRVLTSIPRCKECLDAEVRHTQARNAATIHYHQRRDRERRG